jgi:hypothetical protein
VRPIALIGRSSSNFGSPDAPRRLRYVDLARGLFILLMMSSHAIGLAGVPDDSVLVSGWWLPRGWSTVGFVMLSGFAVGLVTTRTHRIPPRRLLRRAGQLVVVLLVSNVILAWLRALFYGRVTSISAFDWLGTLTLQHDLTISVVLLPIAVGLVIIAALVTLHGRVPTIVLCGLVLGLHLVAWPAHHALMAGAVAGPPASQSFLAWLRDYALLPFVSVATLGFGLGLGWRGLVERVQVNSRIVGPLALLAVLAAGVLHPVLPQSLAMTANVLFQFFIVMLIALSVAAFPRLARAAQPAALVGRYGLMAFLFHRPLLHMTNGGANLVGLSPSARYAVMLAVAAGGCAVLAVIRRRSPALDAGFKRIWL